MLFTERCRKSADLTGAWNRASYYSNGYEGPREPGFELGTSATESGAATARLNRFGSSERLMQHQRPRRQPPTTLDLDDDENRLSASRQLLKQMQAIDEILASTSPSKSVPDSQHDSCR